MKRSTAYVFVTLATLAIQAYGVAIPTAVQTGVNTATSDTDPLCENENMETVQARGLLDKVKEHCSRKKDNDEGKKNKVKGESEANDAGSVSPPKGQSSSREHSAAGSSSQKSKSKVSASGQQLTVPDDDSRSSSRSGGRSSSRSGGRSRPSAGSGRSRSSSDTQAAQDTHRNMMSQAKTAADAANNNAIYGPGNPPGMTRIGM